MAQISLRVDDVVKLNAEKVCNELGISMATAINIYLRKLGREKRIPFEVSVEPNYQDIDTKRLCESIEQAKEGKLITKSIQELEALEK